MNLAKWLRKNNTKVMAVVAIFIFIGFVAPEFLGQLSQRRANRRTTIAYFADNREITNYDLAQAQREMEILRLLQADRILRNINIPMFRVQDLNAALLAELLFSDRTNSPALSEYIKQMVRAGRYRISDKQIDDIYVISAPSEIYWLLLNSEAQLSGLTTPDNFSGTQLARIIPQLFNGVTYSQLIASMADRQGASEEEILTAFSKLLTLVSYARTICIGEDLTNSQIMHTASWEAETIDVEFVIFDSDVFAEDQKEPGEEELIEHFNKYKNFFPGDANDQNPYGFGYKLDNRVQLEYVAVKLNDVSAIIAAPTQEDAEEFYKKHREEFTVSVPSDPNDPNSPQTERIKSYGEVAAVISKNLLRDKISSEAKRILQEAVALAEAGLQAANVEPAKISSEQFKQLAGDYAAIAEQLSEKYKIKVYAGQTGMLTAADCFNDKYLGAMFLQSGEYNTLGLVRAVFAVDQLAVSELGPFSIQKPRLYENIGPASDMLGRIMMIVRVIDAEKASEPENLYQTFGKDSLVLDEDQKQGEKVYSVKKVVTKDLKRLAAMDKTRNKAEEFIRLAEKEGWDDALAKFNKLYGLQDTEDADGANRPPADEFKLQKSANLQRYSAAEREMTALQSRGNPMERLLVNKAEIENLLINQLYSLVPQDSNTADALPLVMELKPAMTYYCIKNLSVVRLEQGQYDRIKAFLNYKEDFIQSQSLAPVQFNPENILKRMKFRWARQDQETTDGNTPSDSEEDL